MSKNLWKEVYYPGVGNVIIQDPPPGFFNPQKVEINLGPAVIDHGPFRSEAQLQSACFLYSWNRYTHFRRLFFKIHNEGKKGGRRGTIDRSMGIVPGEPDILWVFPLFAVECKLPGEKQSKDQEKVQMIWELYGLSYNIVYSSQEYVDLLIDKVGY